MGEGINLPYPVYKFRGKPVLQALGLLTGFNGFYMTRHVHLQMGGKVSCLGALLKICLFLGYLVYQLYVGKGYLEFAGSQGIARMQLQHPVDNCNPLTKNSSGCATNFTKVKDLPYCKQNPVVTPGIPKERCMYFDEFDISFNGYQQHSVLVPTRRTKYTQNIDCRDQIDAKPCPQTDHLVNSSTVFVADVEDFTLLIDHSFVSDELDLQSTAWDMIGFYNPCGKGKDLTSPFYPYYLKELVTGQRDVEAQVPSQCAFRPIHRPNGSLTAGENYALERGYAMWMSKWYETLVPWGMFERNPTELAHENPAPFFKIQNGDVIKIKDVLQLLNTSLDDPLKGNRFDGMVLVIDISYCNWKSYTWPNRVKPAYFYSFSLAPANEFKIMMDQSRQITSYHETKDGSKQRVIYDYHGLFVIIQQGGDIGSWSLLRVFLLVLGAMIIDSVYRSTFTCCVLNLPCCGDLDEGVAGDIEDHKKHDDIRAETGSHRVKLEPFLIQEFSIGTHQKQVCGGLLEYDVDADEDYEGMSLGQPAAEQIDSLLSPREGSEDPEEDTESYTLCR